MKTAVIAVLLAVIAPRPSPAQAPPPGDPDQIAALASELGLSPAQQASLRDLSNGLRKARIQAQADIEIATIDLESALSADDPDHKVVSAHIDRIGALETTLRKRRILTMLSARKLLTPDQRRKLAELAPPDVAAVPPVPPVPPVASIPPPRPPVPPRGTAIRGTRTGSLEVMTQPWADIYLDGKKIGVSPLRIDVAPGRHVLKMLFRGGSARTQALIVEPGQTTRIHVKDGP